MRVRVAKLALLACLCAGCGQATQNRQGNHTASQLDVATLHAHPQAVEPTAGAAAPSYESASAGQVVSSEPAIVSVGPPVSGLPQPVSLSQVKQELATSGVSGQGSRATLTPSGLAIPPVNAPPIIKAMIEAGNTIAHLPYRYGGGHASFRDTAYDCSGSLSYVFASVHLLNTTVDSGQLMHMGDSGPGRWITIYANPGHTFMELAGLRFDTVALAQTGSRWSDRPPNEPDLATFAIRHPPGF